MTGMTQRGLIALAAAVCSCPTGVAQETFLIRAQRAATPASPEVQLLVSAAFDEADYALASAAFELEAASGMFLRADVLLDRGPCEICPQPDGRFVRTIRPGQFHFPTAGIFGDPSNPIAVASAVWTTDDFAPHDVPMSTHTTAFRVYVDEGTSMTESRMDSFGEGSGIIRVRRCYIDCDGDDEATIFDFLCFMNAFQAGDFYADCDESGTLDVFDFLCFQNEFMAGCP